MNITEESFRSYISLFHETLEDTAGQYLRAEYRSYLLHLSLLPARIVGYVSTQFGVAIEYFPAPQTEISIVRGSERIENLFVQAPRHIRHTKPMFVVQEGPPDFHISGGLFCLSVEGTFPFHLKGPNASFRFGDVAFRIGHWSREVKYAETFGNRTAEFWSPEHAVARAKDEVIAALLQAKRAEDKGLSLLDYIKLFKERTILLLGDYDNAGLERLKKISEVLVAHGYDPVLVKDIPDQPAQDLPQKVSTIGSLARFVMVDDSSRSGHLMEIQLCKQNNWITVLLRQNAKGGSWMTAGASILSNVILEQPYDDQNHFSSVSMAIQWAEEKVLELERKFDGLYPWRIRSKNDDPVTRDKCI